MEINIQSQDTINSLIIDKKDSNDSKESKTIDYSLIKKLFGLKNRNYFNHYLKAIFPDFCSFKDNHSLGISRIKFIDFIKLPVFLSEKIFYSMNKHTKDYLDIDEITDELGNLYYGSFEETATFIFHIYDFDYDGFIIPEDIKLVLSYLPLKGDKTLLNYKYQMDSLAHIEQVVDDTFDGKSKLDLQSYLEVIKKTSDIFLQMLCYLYQRCPFSEEYVKILSKTRQHSVKELPQISLTLNQDSLSTENSKYEISDKSLRIENTQRTNSDIVVRKKNSSSNDLITVKGLKSWSNQSIKLVTHSNNILSPVQEFLDTNVEIYNRKRQKSQTTKKSKFLFSEPEPAESISDNASTAAILNRQHTISAEVSGLTGVVRLSSVKLELEMSKRRSYNPESGISNILGAQKLKFKQKLKTTKFVKVKGQINVESLECHGSTVKEDSMEDNDDTSVNCDEVDSEEEEEVKVDHEGEVFKWSQKQQRVKSYWMVLRGKDLYYYEDQSKENLLKMRNIIGCFIKEVGEKTINKKSKFYSFQILFYNKTREYLLVNRILAKEWINTLRTALDYRNFFDCYEILDDIGNGSYGVVKLGLQVSTKRKVAIKLITKSRLKPNELDFVKREIDILKFNTHPNIVEFLDHYENSEYIFIIIEYLKYGDLKDFINKKVKKGELIKESTAALIAYQIADGLD